MLYHDIINVYERIDINEISVSKERDVFHYAMVINDVYEL